ncbi:DUF202 domain-containing protein [Streptomyces roseicoloratus]|uniref:DUF202 domain-containing protein n=1 Tax=Streptomyces roseicoloratus TaxID=2508722 RepID=A0ABY9S1L1_9ACTN|nr:DUF202 domain-containing protein [Streptomyces roseicoloratus]WMX47818.1 DUF202 domain-containing protein [Streptomyces roseicoloratus]
MTGAGSGAGDVAGAGSGGSGTGFAAADRDPGLQPERTRLAWRRTTLSATVVAVLAAKQAIHDDVTAPGLVAAGLSALVWIGFLAVAHRRIQSLHATRPQALSHRGALLATASTVAFAGFAVAVLL